MIFFLLASWASSAFGVAIGKCPHHDVGTPPFGKRAVPDDPTYKQALQTLDIKQLHWDLTDLMTNSQSCWPADGGHYGGLMIRLAWHCSGTYRTFDQKGGCEGGRLLYPPEEGWADNANLDHARALLVPIKNKHGDALSWGDLITFAGTVAIRSMGGPTLPHCFGRTDQANGSESDIFGVAENWTDTGCKVQGNCQMPLGAVTVGLIYVNPEGPLKNKSDPNSGQNPDPVESAIEIREVFGRMGMNDSETAALIAGGHAFGKCHAETSGFEGPWTTTPDEWSMSYIKGMLEDDWEMTKNSKQTVQWKTVDPSSAHSSTMRLTADLALVKDKDYKALLEEWNARPELLETAFAAAWDKLVTSGNQYTNGKRCEPPTTIDDSRASTWSWPMLAPILLMCTCVNAGSV